MTRLFLFMVALIAAMFVSSPARAGQGFDGSTARSDWTQAVDATGLYGRYNAIFPVGFDGNMHFFGGRLIAAPQPAGGGINPLLGLWTGSSQVWLDLESLDPGARLDVYRTRWGPGFVNTNPIGGSTTAVYYMPPETYGISVLFLNSVFGCGSVAIETESGATAWHTNGAGHYTETWGYLSDVGDPISMVLVDNCGATGVGIANIAWAQGPNIGFVWP